VLHGDIFKQERDSRLPLLIIVFAKVPRPGFVKTRLALEPTAAASLYTEFVNRTLENVFKFREEADLELLLDIPHAAWAEFSIARTVQHDGDLGVKLYAALEHGLSAGHPNVVILGSDSPTLPPEHIRWLLNCDADVALGPTLDGGYYGIACRKVIPGMFNGVRWSSRDALRDTISSAVACGLCCTIGPDWFDVDRPEDLLRLRNNASEASTL
jgi:rSAM/selenodomain-associated transferase 1